MRRRKRLRRKEIKKRRIMVIVSMFAVSFLLASGYAAFSTNLSINAKGNLKECFAGKKWDFDFKNQAQEFTASCNGTYKFELWGAGNSYAGGGYTKGEIQLTNNDKFYVYVGEKGHNANGDTIGGYNGGGASSETSQGMSGMTGSGSTDVRTVSGDWDNFTSLKSRIMVAGGAGGVGSNTNFLGSNGGGLEGYDAYSSNSDDIPYIGKKGAQTAGGLKPNKGSCGQTYGDEGLFGKGGSGGMSRETASTGGGSGGGSGYFGGSGASGLCNGTYPAGGGSSFISGHSGCIAITENSTSDNIVQRTGANNVSCIDNPTANLCSHHYSTYVFSNTVMIDGAGYEWTSQKGEYVGQVQPDATTKKGNQDNGHARITLVTLN